MPNYFIQVVTCDEIVRDQSPMMAEDEAYYLFSQLCEKLDAGQKVRVGKAVVGAEDSLELCNDDGQTHRTYCVR